MKAKLLIFFCLLLFLNSSSAQFSVENYLAAPFHEAEIEGLVKQLEYVENESFRSPVFREMEVRLRSNDFNLSPEDYRLRLSFMNPVEQVRNKKYRKVKADYLQSKYDFETNLLLAGRYKQLARHYYLSQYKQEIINDLIQLDLTSGQLKSNSDLKTILEADESILKKELKLAEVNTAIDLLEFIMQEIQGERITINWVGFDMISVDQMKKVLFNDSVAAPIEVLLAQKSLKLEEQTFRIEKAEAWRNIGFFQAEYDTDRGKDLNDHLGFQLGLLIPIFNPDKPELKREMLELLESENKVKQKLQETKLDKQSLNSELIGNIAAYELVSHRLETFEVLGNDLNYENAEEYLALVNYLAYLNSLKNEYYLNCVNIYIDLLALSGQLTKEPVLNYLDKNLNSFSVK